MCSWPAFPCLPNLFCLKVSTLLTLLCQRLWQSKFYFCYKNLLFLLRHKITITSPFWLFLAPGIHCKSASIKLDSAPFYAQISSYELGYPSRRLWQFKLVLASCYNMIGIFSWIFTKWDQWLCHYSIAIPRYAEKIPTSKYGGISIVLNSFRPIVNATLEYLGK